MDNRVSQNVADTLEASNTISLLKQQVAKLSEDVKNWKIGVDVEVQPIGGHYIIVVRSEAGGRIYQEAISAADVQYFYDDKDAIIRHMANNILITLLRERLVEKMTPKITTAMQNIHQLTKGFTQ